jgi:hypothetical protein
MNNLQEKVSQPSLFLSEFVQIRVKIGSMSSNVSNSSLALTPLGAGDLIDRAIRFYRQNFWTFVWIASPPILLGTLFSIGWTILGRELFNITASARGEDAVIYVLFNLFGGLVILFLESIATLMVMGGASRNFVRHILFGEPITFRETFANVYSRIGGLFAASLFIVSLLGIYGLIVFYIGLTILALTISIIALTMSGVAPLAIIFAIALGGAIIFGTGWLFFLVAARFAYIPQIMLVEGQSVGAAIGRSTSLASGNVLRIYALFVFTVVATYSALLLFLIPLSVYASLNGIQFFANDPDATPAWYIIANQVISQVSLILLMPIWMIGLCLLYVDDRVRHEGYDIELMSARNLGEIPAVPTQYSNPLQPALSNTPIFEPPPPPANNSGITTLGLDR